MTRPPTDSYLRAQRALAELKAAVHLLLCDAGDAGMSNANIGRSLGIYAGHKGHEGHISRTLLAMLEAEGVVSQNSETKKWKLVRHGDDPSESDD